MVDPIDDILQQARRGSVAAIVQVLNQKLAGTGVRTRAIFVDGILQLLCEAARVDLLEQSFVVGRIQQILESIAPRKIRRVKISSRIVQELQLLWLEEISQHPDRLLWCQEIAIAKPNIYQRLMKREKTAPTKSKKPPLPTKSPANSNREKQLSRLAFMQGMSLTLLLLLASLGLYYWLRPTLMNAIQVQIPEVSLDLPPSADDSPATREPVLSTVVAESENPFAEAVRIAQKAAAAGQVARSSAEWLDLAVQWQRASDLMGAVAPEHERYEIARDRQVRYRQNSEVALQEAEKRRSQNYDQ